MLLLIIFLALALLTGSLTFSGLLVGSSILVLFKILWPIFAILFLVSLVHKIFFQDRKLK